MEDNDINTHLLIIINKNTIGLVVIWLNYSQEFHNDLKKKKNREPNNNSKVGSVFKTPLAPNKQYKYIILIFPKIL